MGLLFIASQPRSGSTLLQSLLSNNNFVSTTSEPWLLLPFISYNRPDLQKGVFNSNLAKIGIEDYINKFSLNNYFKEEIQKFIDRLYEPLSGESTKYILDKTPRYYEILDSIVEIFPDAKVIVLKRNPLDVLKSIISTWDVENFPQLSFYSRDILKAPFLMQQFIEKNKTNDNVREVLYENLTKSPEDEIAKLYKWLDIEFDSSVLDYKKNNKTEGVMGDKVGVYKYDKVINHQGNRKELLDKSSFWKAFFQGYTAYLGADFLCKYGDYLGETVKKTKVFKDFLFLNSINYYGNKELSFRGIFSLVKFKIKAKFVSEYKY